MKGAAMNRSIVPIVRRMILSCAVVLAGIGAAAAETGNPWFPQSFEGGRGLLLMQSARSMGKSAVSLGFMGFAAQREYPVAAGLTRTDNTTVGAFLFAAGLTDEVDITGSAYGFFDGRPYAGNLLYGHPESGIGSARLGIKIRFPFRPDRHFQIASKLGAVFGASDRQLDGLAYRWTRTDTDIEGSLLQTLDLGGSLSVHTEEGYVLSGSNIWADQYVLAAGIDLHPSNRLTIGIEANNRTFDGIGPLSVFRAGSNPGAYYGGAPNVGNPRFVQIGRAHD
jgi:hypothetical protein